uniref:PH domain-containing protein n=1 Tax=Macrostomum lignano TaxID=282301 RepID=A0A1I8HU18_9PLAT
MPDSQRSNGSLGSSVPGESIIAFGYIRVLRTGKERFFVLKSVPKASPWDFQGGKALVDYYLYMFKNEKSYQKNEPKHFYNLSGVILLSRCTKGKNNTVLGVCFQEDALFLKFSSEDELNRWYFHLSEIYNVKRNCRWPELLSCYSVTLKPVKLASAVEKHGKPDLPGQYRFCLTQSAVLLVKENLLNPELCLPYPCIRGIGHVVNSSTAFEINLGRLSPLGEGELRFKVEHSSMQKELTDALFRCLTDHKGQAPPDGGKPKNRRARRNSRGSTDLPVQHSDSLQTIVRRGSSMRYASQHESKSISTFSERTYGRLGGSLSDGQRTHSQPLGDNFDDYCDLSRDLTQEASRSQAQNNQSLNSSSSLSGKSEQAGEPDSASSAADAQQTGRRSPQSGSDDYCAAARVASWHFNNLQACQGTASPLLGSRANSIGDRPQATRPGSYLPSSYSVPSYYGEPSQTAGHREDRQVFVEMSFGRPRTRSDASRYRLGFRSRTGSYGNRSAYRLNGQVPTPKTVEEALARYGEFSTELQSLVEAGAPEECGNYVPMSLGPAAEKSKEAKEAEPEPKQGEVLNDDYYWMGPSRVDDMLMQRGVDQQRPQQQQQQQQ